MSPSFTPHTKYRVVYRSNERSNAVPYEFTGDFLGWSSIDELDAMFSCRPMSGTMSIDTRWYHFDEIEEVSKDVANRSPHKVARSRRK